MKRRTLVFCLALAFPAIVSPQARRAARPNIIYIMSDVATLTGLPTNVGTNRVNWDLRYDAPPTFGRSYEISANPGKLTVDGASATQKVTVRNDPRSPATTVALRAQHALQMKLYDGISASWDGAQQMAGVRTALRAVSDTSAAVKSATTAITITLDSVAGGGGGRGFRGGGGTPAPTFRGVNGALVGQLMAQDNADLAPTPAMLAAYANACKNLTTVQALWAHVIATNLPALNLELARRGKATLPLPVRPVSSARCQ